MGYRSLRGSRHQPFLLCILTPPISRNARAVMVHLTRMTWKKKDSKETQKKSKSRNKDCVNNKGKLKKANMVRDVEVVCLRSRQE